MFGVTTARRPAFLATTARLVLATVVWLVVGSFPAWGAPVTCGQTITQDTRLTSDLTCPPGNGLVIGADNIILNLGGHTISGNFATPFPTTGVEINSHSGVTVRNGTIEGFDLLVDMGAPLQAGQARGAHNRILGLTFANSDGAIGGFADSSRFAFNTSVGPQNPGGFNGGDMAISGDGDEVDHNVSLYNVTFLTGAHTRAAHNRFDVVDLRPTGSGGDVIAHNTAQSLFVFGSSLSPPSALIVGNTLAPPAPGQARGDGGVLLDDASHVILVGNVVRGEPRGIQLTADSGTTDDGDELIGNLVSGASGDGISVPGQVDGIKPIAANTVVRQNLTANNGHDGINNQSTTTILTKNIANDNANLGIESVPGATDGGGNRAHGNGNPLQCTNVACSP